MRQSAILCYSLVAIVLALGGALFYAVEAAEEQPLVDSASAELVEGRASVPKQYVGPQACIECHQAEYSVWASTAHATNAYDLLRTSSNAERYAANLDIDPGQAPNHPRCLACHSTPQGVAANNTGVVLGVTCEACHNAAGGEGGWLNIHATYGSHGERRADESLEHRQQRIARCRSAGQYRCDDLYSLAKQCYECHIIGDEELVVRGGHHPGNPGFEMSSWFEDEVRHNLCLDTTRNGLAPSLWIDGLWRPNRQPAREIDHRRVMYVVSTLVDLEVSLRNRGRAEHSSFASAAATRIIAASSRLAAIAKESENDELEQAVDAVTELEPILFSPPAQDDAQLFLDAAGLVRDIAMQISSADNGEQFSAVDRLLDSQVDQPHPAGQ